MMLENQRVKLTLLNLDNYNCLESIALEKDLIYYSPSDISTPKQLKAYVEVALDGYKRGTILPFIVYDKKFETYAGSTRFGNIDKNNSVVHIGWTWIGHHFQGTGLNINMKFLMLQYAFEVLQFQKVEFRIDERNEKSKKAVEKLGAKLEGILRSNVILKDGYRRNTCCYGILNSEWTSIKQQLLPLL